jgi:hypothetical protein
MPERFIGRLVDKLEDGQKPVSRTTGPAAARLSSTFPQVGFWPGMTSSYPAFSGDP